MPSDPKRTPWDNGKAPFQLMNIRPSPTERWSDNPNFEGARFKTNPSGKGEHLQMYLDPEKHIERTSRYEGSTDRRHPGTGERQSTADVWIDKKAEASMPPGTRQNGVPVHGAGMVDSLQRGETVRNPVRLIQDPERFPQSGNQPVQGEGHHRVAAAALEQKRARDIGDANSNWGRPVPFTLHSSVAESKEADLAGNRLTMAQAGIAAIKSRAKAFQVATGSRFFPLDTMNTATAAPTAAPEQKPRRRFMRRRA